MLMHVLHAVTDQLHIRRASRSGNHVSKLAKAINQVPLSAYQYMVLVVHVEALLTVCKNQSKYQ